MVDGASSAASAEKGGRRDAGRRPAAPLATCCETGCRKPIWRGAPNRGMCAAHYQWHRRNTPDFVYQRKVCCVPGCFTLERLGGMGRCSAHYRRKLLGAPEWMPKDGVGPISQSRFGRAIEALAQQWKCTPLEALQRLEASR